MKSFVILFSYENIKHKNIKEHSKLEAPEHRPGPLTCLMCHCLNRFPIASLILVKSSFTRKHTPYCGSHVHLIFICHSLFASLSCLQNSSLILLHKLTDDQALLPFQGQGNVDCFQPSASVSLFESVDRETPEDSPH